MNERPLISVIVPIYNVAPYLRKCLDSLKGQTLKDIEVICIDDGSTDESGLIADEYATDTRFRIIHTENRGLSAARNRGIDEAKADWLMFVDSDDWVDKEFCRIPYEAAVENGADLVIFGSDNWKNGKKQKSKNRETPIGLIDELTAHEFGSVSAWNKLYQKYLFEDIRYPEGHVHEDVATTHKLIHISRTIVRLHDCLYHYTIRSGSISHTYTLLNKKDCFESAINRYRSLISWGCSEKVAKQFLCGSAIGFLSVTPHSTDELYAYAKGVIDSVDGIPQGMTWKQKVGFIAWKVDRRVFYFVSMVTGRINMS